jgi:hypothetical protein
MISRKLSPATFWWALAAHPTLPLGLFGMAVRADSPVKIV